MKENKVTYRTYSVRLLDSFGEEEDFVKIKNWVVYQNKMYRKGRLAKWRQLRLERIGFPLSPLGPPEPIGRKQASTPPAAVPKMKKGTSANVTPPAAAAKKKKTSGNPSWQVSWKKLKQFKQRTGFIVPVTPSSYDDLYRWVIVQMQSFKVGTLDANQKKKLEEIGFFTCKSWRERRNPFQNEDDESEDNEETENDEEYGAETGGQGKPAAKKRKVNDEVMPGEVNSEAADSRKERLIRRQAAAAKQDAAATRPDKVKSAPVSTDDDQRTKRRISRQMEQKATKQPAGDEGKSPEVSDSDKSPASSDSSACNEGNTAPMQPAEKKEAAECPEDGMPTDDEDDMEDLNEPGGNEPGGCLSDTSEPNDRERTVGESSLEDARRAKRRRRSTDSQDVGTKICTYLEGRGYIGVIRSIKLGIYTVRYEDGSVKDYYESEMKEIVQEMKNRRMKHKAGTKVFIRFADKTISQGRVESFDGKYYKVLCHGCPTHKVHFSTEAEMDAIVEESKELLAFGVDQKELTRLARRLK